MVAAALATVTTAAVAPVLTRCPGLLVTAQVLARGLALHDLDRNQRQLAAVLDLADLNLDLVANLDDIVHVVDPGAALQLADLGDVEQTVLARQQRDERAKRGRLHHGAEEALPDLRNVRVGDGIDSGPGRLGGRSVRRADVDGAIVLDRDVGAGRLLDRVDHLALRADDLADLVNRNLDRDDARRELAHLAGRVD